MAYVVTVNRKPGPAVDPSRLTDAQSKTVGYLLAKMGREGANPVWHFNNCGCCVSVHDTPGPIEFGYIVNRAGQSFWENVE